MLDQAGIMMAQGSSIASERICGVNDNMQSCHYHDYFELYYLESGERYQMLQNQLYLLRAGELILFSPYIMHYSYGQKDVPFKRLILYFRREEVRSQQLLAALQAGNGVYHPSPQDQRVIHRLLESILTEQNSKCSFQAEYQKALLDLLLLTIVRQQKTPWQQEDTSRISQIISYIHTHYPDNITLELLTQQFYVSPYHLCREFKRYTNRTIIEYVNITRIMNAQRMIMETDKSITEIGKDTGFSNITHFNRVFKNTTGTTPSAYRKQYRTQMLLETCR